jgi:hypothetical protein
VSTTRWLDGDAVDSEDRDTVSPVPERRPVARAPRPQVDGKAGRATPPWKVALQVAEALGPLDTREVLSLSDRVGEVRMHGCFLRVAWVQ